MGGIDKGLQLHQGLPLVQHALARLSPQVGTVMVSANRNLSTYASMGVAVWPDETRGFEGPLAGFLAGLAHCETPYLVTVPCDTPHFPGDLVQKLAQRLEAEAAEIAMAATTQENGLRTQPVFCMMKSDLKGSLIRFLLSGQRKIDCWTMQHHCVMVPFEDEHAFFNANTPEELLQLQAPGP